MILIKNRNKELFALHDKIFSSAALDISISQSSRRILGDIPPETLSGKPPIERTNWIYGQIPSNKGLVCVAEESHLQSIEDSLAALDISISQSSRRILGDIPPETLSGKPPIERTNWIYGQIPSNKGLVCVAEESHLQSIEDSLLTKGSSQQFADDIDCYCVDEWGDEEFTNSCWHENDDLTRYYQAEPFASELV